LISDSEELDLGNNDNRHNRDEEEEQEQEEQDQDQEEEQEQEEQEQEEEQEEENGQDGGDNQGSEFEYSSSEHDEKDSEDSYVYPFETSSDDSWASLDSDGCMQKILAKLPTYDPPDSDQDANKSRSQSPSKYSDHGNDSAIENEEAPKSLETYTIEKLLPMVEEFEMSDYDGDVETPPTNVEKPPTNVEKPVNGTDKLNQNKKPLPQAMTIAASTPSPLPSDDDGDGGDTTTYNNNGRKEEKPSKKKNLYHTKRTKRFG